MTEDHISFLSEFLNPVYLQPRTMNALASRFFEESSLELHSFLATKLANKLENGLREVDMKDGLDGASRHGKIPPHNAGTESSPWKIVSPPHKRRYCALEPYVYGPPEEGQTSYTQSSSDELLRSLQDELLPSNAFRAWLSVVSQLLPLRYSVEARRFRPGLDYTLATSDDKETRLDVVLGLTPDMVTRRTRKGKARQQWNGEEKPRGFAAGQWGGWEVIMFLILIFFRKDLIFYSVTWHLTTKTMTLLFTGQVDQERSTAVALPGHLQDRRRTESTTSTGLHPHPINLRIRTDMERKKTMTGKTMKQRC